MIRHLFYYNAHSVLIFIDAFLNTLICFANNNKITGINIVFKQFIVTIIKTKQFAVGRRGINLSHGSGTYGTRCHTWHAKQFPMARRSSMFYISILL